VPPALLPEVAARAEELRAIFDEPAPITVGIEEEAMLLDAETLDLAPVGLAVVAAAADGALLKREAPAGQVEAATEPAADVPAAIAAVAEGRRALLAAASAVGVRPACVGVHPFAAGEGELNRSPHYDRAVARYGSFALRQQVASLQVHVCVRGSERALAVYNALRSYLPELAALAANAPFYEGRDTGCASVRPLICTLLPFQGLPPLLHSWQELAEGLAWAGDEASWWWEMRPHRAHGTLELRVPDAQASLADAEAVAAVCHALATWLAERFDAGERLPAVPTWMIAENRLSAARLGIAGTMRDLETGEDVVTIEHLGRLLDVLAPVGDRIGCGAGIARARELLAEGGGATKLRAAAADGDLRAATAWLAERYQDEPLASQSGSAWLPRFTRRRSSLRKRGG